MTIVKLSDASVQELRLAFAAAEKEPPPAIKGFPIGMRVEGARTGNVGTVIPCPPDRKLLPYSHEMVFWIRDVDNKVIASYPSQLTPAVVVKSLLLTPPAPLESTPPPGFKVGMVVRSVKTPTLRGVVIPRPAGAASEREGFPMVYWLTSEKQVLGALPHGIELDKRDPPFIKPVPKFPVGCRVRHTLTHRTGVVVGRPEWAGNEAESLVYWTLDPTFRSTFRTKGTLPEFLERV